MLVRLSAPFFRWGFIVLGVLSTALFSYFGIRSARAAHDIDLNTKAGYEEAARVEPGNAENWYQLGHYWQHSLEDADPKLAIRYYRTSLALNPRSADAWMELGTVYELEGDPQSARDAFLRAKQAYPLSSEVAWRYGNFLLRQNEIPQALTEIHRAVYVEPRRSAEAVSRCWRVYPDIQALLDKVIPPDRDVYLDVIQVLSADDQFGAALQVWARLLALHPQFRLAQAIPFTYTLVEKHEIEDARRVWDDAIRLSNASLVPDPPGSVLWDGGFESGVLGGGLAWYFPSPSEGTRTALDSHEKHSGQQSLRVTFDGKHNIGFQGPCNNAPVQPGLPYVLSAWIRTQSLTTDQGVRVRLSWMQGPRWFSVETPDLLGTQPWTQVQTNWISPKDIHQVRVCVVRDPSQKLDSRIQGAVWLDDISLTLPSALLAKP